MTVGWVTLENYQPTTGSLLYSGMTTGMSTSGGTDFKQHKGERVLC